MTTYEITFNEKTTFGKNLIAFFLENKKRVKLKDPTLLTEEEFDAKIQEAREQFARGEYIVYDSEAFRKKYGLK